MSLFASGQFLAPETSARLSTRFGVRQADRALPVPAEAVGLLGEVLARLPGVERPVVMVLASAGALGPSQVAYDLAACGACHVGRTLLVSAAAIQTADATGARALSLRITELLGGQPGGITPDALVTGLYYAPPPSGTDAGEAARAIRSWLATPHDFRFIVIDSPAIAAEPRALALAAMCSGCLVAVAAGRTRQAELRATERQLRSAQVGLLGTVLHGAQTIRLGFGRSAGRA